MTDQDALKLLQGCGQDVWHMLMDHVINNSAMQDKQFKKEVKTMEAFSVCLNQAGIEVVNPFKMRLDD